MNVCRVCLKIMYENETTPVHFLEGIPYDSEDSDLKTKLKFCIPGLTLITGYHGGVVCHTCFASLHSTHDFIKTCIDTEKKIEKLVLKYGIVNPFRHLLELHESTQSNHRIHLDITEDSEEFNLMTIKEEPEEEPLDWLFGRPQPQVEEIEVIYNPFAANEDSSPATEEFDCPNLDDYAFHDVERETGTFDYEEDPDLRLIQKTCRENPLLAENGITAKHLSCFVRLPRIDTNLQTNLEEPVKNDSQDLLVRTYEEPIETEPTTANEIYTCEICGKIVKLKGAFLRHVRSHKKHAKYFNCSFCKEQFRLKSNYVKHCQSHQTNVEHSYSVAQMQKKNGVYRCYVCDKPFAEYRSLIVHMKIKHFLKKDRKVKAEVKPARAPILTVSEDVFEKAMMSISSNMDKINYPYNSESDTDEGPPLLEMYDKDSDTESTIPDIMPDICRMIPSPVKDNIITEHFVVSDDLFIDGDDQIILQQSANIRSEHVSSNDSLSCIEATSSSPLHDFSVDASVSYTNNDNTDSAEIQRRIKVMNKVLQSPRIKKTNKKKRGSTHAMLKKYCYRLNKFSNANVTPNSLKCWVTLEKLDENSLPQSAKNVNENTVQKAVTIKNSKRCSAKVDTIETYKVGLEEPLRRLHISDLSEQLNIANRMWYVKNFNFDRLSVVWNRARRRKRGSKRIKIRPNMLNITTKENSNPEEHALLYLCHLCILDFNNFEEFKDHLLGEHNIYPSIDESDQALSNVSSSKGEKEHNIIFENLRPRGWPSFSTPEVFKKGATLPGSFDKTSEGCVTFEDLIKKKEKNVDSLKVSVVKRTQDPLQCDELLPFDEVESATKGLPESPGGSKNGKNTDVRTLRKRKPIDYVPVSIYARGVYKTKNVKEITKASVQSVTPTFNVYATYRNSSGFVTSSGMVSESPKFSVSTLASLASHANRTQVANGESLRPSDETKLSICDSSASEEVSNSLCASKSSGRPTTSTASKVCLKSMTIFPASTSANPKPPPLHLLFPDFAQKACSQVVPATASKNSSLLKKPDQTKTNPSTSNSTPLLLPTSSKVVAKGMIPMPSGGYKETSPSSKNLKVPIVHSGSGPTSNVPTSSAEKPNRLQPAKPKFPVRNKLLGMVMNGPSKLKEPSSKKNIEFSIAPTANVAASASSRAKSIFDKTRISVAFVDPSTTSSTATTSASAAPASSSTTVSSPSTSFSVFLPVDASSSSTAARIPVVLSSKNAVKVGEELFFLVINSGPMLSDKVTYMNAAGSKVLYPVDNSGSMIVPPLTKVRKPVVTHTSNKVPKVDVVGSMLLRKLHPLLPKSNASLPTEDKMSGSLMNNTAKLDNEILRSENKMLALASKLEKEILLNDVSAAPTLPSGSLKETCSIVEEKESLPSSNITENVQEMMETKMMSLPNPEEQKQPKDHDSGASALPKEICSIAEEKQSLLHKYLRSTESAENEVLPLPKLEEEIQPKYDDNTLPSTNSEETCSIIEDKLTSNVAEEVNKTDTNYLCTTQFAENKEIQTNNDDNAASTSPDNDLKEIVCVEEKQSLPSSNVPENDINNLCPTETTEKEMVPSPTPEEVLSKCGNDVVSTLPNNLQEVHPTVEEKELLLSQPMSPESDREQLNTEAEIEEQKVGDLPGNTNTSEAGAVNSFDTNLSSNIMEGIETAKNITTNSKESSDGEKDFSSSENKLVPCSDSKIKTDQDSSIIRNVPQQDSKTLLDAAKYECKECLTNFENTSLLMEHEKDGQCNKDSDVESTIEDTPLALLVKNKQMLKRSPRKHGSSGTVHLKSLESKLRTRRFSSRNAKGHKCADAQDGRLSRDLNAPLDLSVAAGPSSVPLNLSKSDTMEPDAQLTNPVCSEVLSPLHNPPHEKVLETPVRIDLDQTSSNEHPNNASQDVEDKFTHAKIYNHRCPYNQRPGNLSKSDKRSMKVCPLCTLEYTEEAIKRHRCPYFRDHSSCNFRGLIMDSCRFCKGDFSLEAIKWHNCLPVTKEAGNSADIVCSKCHIRFENKDLYAAHEKNGHLHNLYTEDDNTQKETSHPIAEVVAPEASVAKEINNECSKSNTTFENKELLVEHEKTSPNNVKPSAREKRISVEEMKDGNTQNETSHPTAEVVAPGDSVAKETNNECNKSSTTFKNKELLVEHEKRSDKQIRRRRRPCIGSKSKKTGCKFCKNKYTRKQFKHHRCVHFKDEQDNLSNDTPQDLVSKLDVYDLTDAPNSAECIEALDFKSTEAEHKSDHQNIQSLDASQACGSKTDVTDTLDKRIDAKEGNNTSSCSEASAKDEEAVGIKNEDEETILNLNPNLRKFKHRRCKDKKGDVTSSDSTDGKVKKKNTANEVKTPERERVILFSKGNMQNCIFCDKIFTAREMKYHKLLHFKDDPSLAATMENVELNELSAIKNAIDELATKIQEIKKYECIHCDMAFVTKSQIKMHLKLTHPDKKDHSFTIKNSGVSN